MLRIRHRRVQLDQRRRLESLRPQWARRWPEEVAAPHPETAFAVRLFREGRLSRHHGRDGGIVGLGECMGGGVEGWRVEGGGGGGRGRGRLVAYLTLTQNGGRSGGRGRAAKKQNKT